MCECVKKVDEQLRKNGLRVAQAILISPDMSQLSSAVIIATERLDPRSRKPVPKLTAAFCPFCGTKTGETPAAAEVEE
jgi:hypothetical protein